jgi:hypothetical protein
MTRRIPEMKFLIAIFAVLALTLIVLTAIGPERLPPGHGMEPFACGADASAGDPNPEDVCRWRPGSGQVEPGVEYKYAGGVHCGILPNFFDFDGSFWTPVDQTKVDALMDAVLAEELPIDRVEGTIVLSGPDRAEFRSGDHVLQMQRVDGPVVVRFCE